MLEIRRSARLPLWYALAAAVLILDQFTKASVVHSFEYGDSLFISSYFNLVRAHNSGAAFSFLSDAGGWQRWAFSGLAASVSIVLVVWIARLSRAQWLECMALALILGGALGNLWDRLILGYVIDFLDFHWAGRHFPAFNVADSAITCGAILLIFDAWRSGGGEQTDDHKQT
ncbi:MAG: signal peptidase II [Porticoccaceae bacterium]|nr:signal peptidase II [Porticoccaceae bacterium]